METYTKDYCEQMVLRWIGDGAPRHKLRRKRPRASDWQPFGKALDRLVAAGKVRAVRQPKAPGSSGYAATLYLPQ